MARKYRIAAVCSIAVVAVIGALTGGAFYAARQVRPFYQQALQVEPDVLERGSRELESRATALYSEARQQGHWQASFTTEQINGWLATQLAANQGRELPANIRDPRVAISKDVLTLGFRTTSGGVDTVVTVDASVFLTDEGAVAVRLMSVRAGALPLPVMRLADELADACQKLTLPVRWTQHDGEPVALVETHGDPHSDDSRLFIDTIELGESELYVAGHTERTSTDDKPATAAAKGDRQARYEVVIDDYEVRLTPRHKDGALQIARRAEPVERNDAKADPDNSGPPTTK
jgi:hypothetical protein